MTSFLIVVHYLNGQIAQGTLSQDPVKPAAGDASTPIDGGSLPLQGSKYIIMTDEELEAHYESQLNNPWWTFQFQWVDGLDGLFTITNRNPIEVVEGDEFEMPVGWIELMDDQGNLVWVNEEAVESITPNGPYWRGQ